MYNNTTMYIYAGLVRVPSAAAGRLAFFPGESGAVFRFVRRRLQTGRPRRFHFTPLEKIKYYGKFDRID